MTDATAPETYEVAISRYFDAPVNLVYQAFTDPEHLAQWFGPLMFSVPLDTVSIDPRAGGHWRMTMVGKDDTGWQSPIDATFTEVVENQLLVGYEVTTGVPGLADGTRLTLSIEFIPEGDGTRLELRQGPLPAQTREMAAVGWSQSFHKLDALLATPEKFRPGNNNEGDAS